MSFEKTVERAPALLTLPHYGGTLAAIRCLGEHGVEVQVASDRAMSPGAWSRHVAQRVKCPPTSSGPAELARWLVRFGRKHPGSVLYPTSDDMAWVISRYAEHLQPHFRLYSPPISALRALLDKSMLHARCRELGVPTPNTWSPRSEAELAELCVPARTLLVKPRSQLFCPAGGKGARATGREQTQRVWREHRLATYQPEILEEIPNLDLPLIQEYRPTGTHGTYSISGFIDHEGRVLTSRASIKVLQNPPHLGVGVCFVSAPVHAETLAQIVKLCRAVGFFGVFEVEFVRDGEQLLLIDFNPRYYGQMGFDIARGAPIPLLVQRAALGEPNLSAQTWEVAPEQAPTMYVDHVTLAWRLGMGLLNGAVTWREATQGYRLTREADGQSLDGWWRDDDPVPSIMAAAALVWHSIRHPRSSVNSLRQGVGIAQTPSVLLHPERTR